LFRHYLKLLRDRTRFEEEFGHPLEEEHGAVGGFRHEFYPCFPPCAFIAAGSVAERNDSNPENPTPALAPGRL